MATPVCDSFKALTIEEEPTLTASELIRKREPRGFAGESSERVSTMSHITAISTVLQAYLYDDPEFEDKGFLRLTPGDRAPCFGCLSSLHVDAEKLLCVVDKHSPKDCPTSKLHPRVRRVFAMSSKPSNPLGYSLDITSVQTLLGDGESVITIEASYFKFWSAFGCCVIVEGPPITNAEADSSEREDCFAAQTIPTLTNSGLLGRNEGILAC
ncbi:hypothetical protein C8034_v010241 [Colletotrichum sidae]|uniref:Uncharacterized protein n=1 Tax=Colletotrichum sidae TaxID=1347389 RepID=A0A4R8TKU1_9PEZI|nr:hypothetical protein C8034_v010241 [Colletotrichum sidae]